jgi:hypothetical protein
MTKVSLALTSLVVCGAFAIFATSCASSDNNNGGSGGTAGGGGGGAGGGSIAPSGDTVTFAKGKASGPMSGYGWVALGAQDSLSSPVCDASGATPPGGTADLITKANPCPSAGGKAVWSSDTALCITGSAPKVMPSAAFPNGDYDAAWGLQIGVNSSEPPGTTLGKTYSTITLNFTGLPTPAGAVMRAEIHRLGDPDATTYCATTTSGTPITLTTFNTACWDNTGTALKATDVPNIDKIGLQVSADLSNTYTVTNLCLTSIAFGN